MIRLFLFYSFSCYTAEKRLLRSFDIKHKHIVTQTSFIVTPNGSNILYSSFWTLVLVRLLMSYHPDLFSGSVKRRNCVNSARRISVTIKSDLFIKETSNQRELTCLPCSSRLQGQKLFHGWYSNQIADMLPPLSRPKTG